jgi:hypothetical protein
MAGYRFSALGSSSERSLKVRRLLRGQDQAGALPAALTISRDANTGAGEDFTDLAAAVQLRLRVAIGLQTLTVKSRLLTGENSVRIRGDPPFLHPW